MTKNWIAVNLVLLLTAALLGWQLWVSVARFKADNDPSKITPVEDLKKKIVADSTLPAMKPQQPYNPADFEAISAKNLFAESRSAEEQTEEAPVAEAPALTVKPVLVGVIQSGAESLALVIDPSAQGSTRRAQSKRLGDGFQGYTITEITPTRMVLESGDRREVIPLYDASRRSGQGGKTPIISTRVVNFGAASGAGTTATARPVVSSPADAARSAAGAAAPSRITTRAGQPVVQPAAEGADRSAQQPQESGDAQGRRVIRTPFGEFTENPAAAQPANELRDAQGRRIIRTPFGDIVRPEPPPTPPPNPQQPDLSTRRQ